MRSPSSTIVYRAWERAIGRSLDGSFAHHENAFLDQRPRDDIPGTSENTGEGRSGNPHPVGGGFLVQSLKIGQPKGFELVQPQRFDFELADRSADGLERPCSSHETDLSELFRSCHIVSQLRTYVHYS